MKYLIIDKRMREIEKNFLKNLGYELIELEKSENVYPEISSHVDIFCCRIDDTLIIEKSQYEYIKNKINSENIEIIERRKFCLREISRRYKI